jgi:hypothetical protein
VKTIVNENSLKKTDETFKTGHKHMTRVANDERLIKVPTQFLGI